MKSFNLYTFLNIYIKIKNYLEHCIQNKLKNYTTYYFILLYLKINYFNSQSTMDNFINYYFILFC